MEEAKEEEEEEEEGRHKLVCTTSSGGRCLSRRDGEGAGGAGLRSVPVSTTGLLASQGLISTTRHRPPTTYHYDRYIHTRRFFVPLNRSCVTMTSF